jgi:hypothetical protein
MATRGRKPKPIEQKVRLGNPGQRPLPKPIEVVSIGAETAIPTPHRFLIGNDEKPGPGMTLWNMIWRAGSPWLKQPADNEMVLLVCEQTDERALLRDKLLRNQLDWRDRTALRHLEKAIASNLAQLGFSPADRARMNVSVVEVNPLEDFRSRLAAKRSTA